MSKPLAPLKNLRKLNLDYTKVSANGIGAFTSNADLQVLSLDNTNVDDAAIDTLRGFRGLTALNLYHTLVTDSGLQSLREDLPDCRIAWERDSAQPTRRR